MIKRLDKSYIGMLASVKEEFFPDGWNEDMLIDAFETDGFAAFGIFENDVLAGFITYTVGLDFADLQDLFVFPKFRRKGYAKELLLYFIDEIKKEKTNKIFLEVRPSNAAAVNLYEKAGFVKIFLRKKYYADGEDAAVMVKEF